MRLPTYPNDHWPISIWLKSIGCNSEERGRVQMAQINVAAQRALYLSIHKIINLPCEMDVKCWRQHEKPSPRIRNWREKQKQDEEINQRECVFLLLFFFKSMTATLSTQSVIETRKNDNFDFSLRYIVSVSVTSFFFFFIWIQRMAFFYFFKLNWFFFLVCFIIYFRAVPCRSYQNQVRISGNR